jgi:hypothetical protein
LGPRRFAQKLILGNVNGGPVPIRFGFADSLATIDYRLPVIADDWIFPSAKKPHSLKRLLNQPAEDVLLVQRASPLSNTVQNERPQQWVSKNHSFVMPSVLHSSEPMPLWTMNSPEGS